MIVFYTALFLKLLGLESFNLVEAYFLLLEQSHEMKEYLEPYVTAPVNLKLYCKLRIGPYTVNCFLFHIQVFWIC